jgi:hypothetical protein
MTNRLDELQNLVTEIHDDIPTALGSNGQIVSADTRYERIADALVMITEELRDRR